MVVCSCKKSATGAPGRAQGAIGLRLWFQPFVKYHMNRDYEICI